MTNFYIYPPRKILRFVHSTSLEDDNELTLLVVQTNASVTSRGIFARVEPALVILERSVSVVKDLARSTY